MLSEDDERIRLNLIRYREHWELTQLDAAQAAEIPYYNWIRYESGHNGVPRESLKRISDFFGVTIDSFYQQEPPLPAAKNRPVILFRAVKGADEDPKVREFVEKIHAEIREFEDELRAAKAQLAPRRRRK